MHIKRGVECCAARPGLVEKVMRYILLTNESSAFPTLFTFTSTSKLQVVDHVLPATCDCDLSITVVVMNMYCR
jgi:hypothetical protein